MWKINNLRKHAYQRHKNTNWQTPTKENLRIRTTLSDIYNSFLVQDFKVRKVEQTFKTMGFKRPKT